MPDNKRDLETEYRLKDKLADIYYKTADFSESAKLIKELLEYARQKDESEYSSQLNNLALVYKSQGKYDEAIELYKQALQIDEKNIGKDHPDYAVHLNNLASVYESLSKYDEAVELYEQALQIFNTVFGENHPSTQTVMENLRACLETQNM